MQKKAAMADFCDLQIHVNGQQTFFLNEKTISRFSGKFRKIIKQEKRRTQIRNSGIEIDEFPGGSDGFELICRFCYSNGNLTVNVSNVCLLHCCAVFLGMTDNLLQRTEAFFEGMFYWSWNDLLICLNSCESFFHYADSFGLVEKLISSLLVKIAQNSDITTLFHCSSSSSSSPETWKSGGFRLSSSDLIVNNNKSSSSPETWKSGGFRSSSSELLVNNSSKTSSGSGGKAWWFDGMTILPPVIIERFVKTLGAYGTDNNSLVLTRFLLHYLKTALQSQSKSKVVNNNQSSLSRSEYGGLADTAVHGVMLMGRSAFSCRGLFWVLRIVSGFGLSRECKGGLERLIGGLLDEAKLDDLLVSGGAGGVYDVNLVVRLIRLFVQNQNQNQNHNHRNEVSSTSTQKMKKVGGLIDKYLGEIAPDQNLKISKFLGVAESLADCARDCFDGVYRAIDIYLESHPSLSLEERTRLCRCLNYEKLSLEACKELAKNPKIPPRVAVEALASQHSNIPASAYDSGDYFVNETSPISRTNSSNQMVLYNLCNDDMKGVPHNVDSSTDQSFSPEQNDALKMNLQRMQWRVVELEKVCREMKGQMSRMVKGKVVITPSHGRSLPRMC